MSNAEAMLSKRQLTWAGLAAFAGCAAACSAPLLAAVFLGSGTAAAVASFVTPGLELAVGGAVFLVAAGALMLRARRRKPSPAVQHEGTAGTAIPIACDPLVFSQEQRGEHHELARNVIVRWPTKREELEDGYRFHYQGKEELFADLARWAASEHRCCAWASFTLEMEPFASDQSGAIRLSMRGGAEGKALLKEGFAMLAGDPRLELFLNPTGKITAESLAARARPVSGCGC